MPNERLKLLNGRVHGYIDYVYGALLLLAPMIFGFAGTVDDLCYIMGAGVLILSLLTRYPLGALKVIPFTAHGWIELVAAFLMLAAPELLGFYGLSRGFFMTMSIVVMAVWFLTDYVGTEIAYAGVDARTGKRETVASR